MPSQEEIDLPFLPFSNSVVQKKFRQQISEAAKEGHTEIVTILAPSFWSKRINASKKDGHISIHLAVRGGHTEIIKILAPLTDDPNAPDKDGITPINLAAGRGYTEIVKILAPLTDDPNAQIKMEIRQFMWQRCMVIQKLSKSWPL